MSASLVPHRYAVSERPYVIVECRECMVILNSSHHYWPEHQIHAQRLADEHNAKHHPAATS